MQVSGKSADKLNTEVNVVPFIDLLSCLISFLLITAVWIQIAAIPASVDVKGKSAPTPPSSQKRLEIRLTSKGFEFKWPESARGADFPVTVPKNKDDFDMESLETLMKKLSSRGGMLTASVSAEDAVEYGAVTRTIDSVKTGGIPAVAVNIN
jgi:biopolymer transport protein TolR